MDAFELWCWRRLLRVPWTARRSNQSILKEINPEYSLERLMLMLKLWYFGHLMQRTNWSSVAPFSSYLRSLLLSQLLASDSQSVGVSASASVLPMNIQDWLPLGLTDLIPLLSKGLSRVFSSTTIQKHQFFGTQPSLWSNSHICTWLLAKP